MYTRVNTIFGPKDRVEAGITQIEGPDRAAVEATSGNRGLTTMVDREAATIIAISYWDEPDRSSEAELTRARQNAVAAAAGYLVAENYVLVVLEHGHRHVHLAGSPPTPPVPGSPSKPATC